jgi:hypothetical protein
MTTAGAAAGPRPSAQAAGHAAAAADFLTQRPGICLTVSAPYGLDTTTQAATTNGGVLTSLSIVVV